MLLLWVQENQKWNNQVAPSRIVISSYGCKGLCACANEGC